MNIVIVTFLLMRVEWIIVGGTIYRDCAEMLANCSLTTGQNWKTLAETSPSHVSQRWANQETLFPSHVSQRWVNQETLFPSHVS